MEIQKKYFNIEDYNNTNVPLEIKKNLEDLEYNEEKEFLKYHQFIVKEYFTRNNQLRGMLFCHGTGQGKTPLAISIANYFREIEKNRKIYVLLSKSLEANFKQNIHKYMQSYYKENEIKTIIEDKYKFISLNASNMFQQIANINKTKDELDYEKKIGTFMNDITNKGGLENSLLIIDEAHNLFNSITNNSKNAIQLYDLIMNTNNIKLIFLTATPMVNDPFELVPCFNMLKGYIYYPDSKILGGNWITTKENDFYNNKINAYDDEEYYENQNIYGGDDNSDDSDNSDNNDNSNNSDNDIEINLEDKKIDNEFNSDYTESENENDENNENENDESENSENNESENSENKNNENLLEESENSENKNNENLLEESEYLDNRTNSKFNNRTNSKFNNRTKNKFKPNKKKYDYTTLFSESIEEFENFFIDYNNNSINNIEKFENRIYGIVSYYGDIYFENTKVRENFPEELPLIIEKIHMSKLQFSYYKEIRTTELEEGKRKSKKLAGRFSSIQGGTTTYRVKSRQMSNFCIPEYALGPIVKFKAREKFINKIKDEDLLKLDIYSPKMNKIFENIKKHNNQPGIVYSQFVSGEGLSIFARILEINGYTNYLDILNNVETYNLGGDEYSDNSDNSNKLNELNELNKLNELNDKNIKQNIKKHIDKNYKLVYAILSGDIPIEKRQEIIKAFNSKDNYNGSIIHVLLISGAVAEGLDLKRGRHGHIMEPFWNEARIDQIKGRLIRYKSHEDLPKDQQNVQFYIYLSDYPENYPKQKIKENTTDVELYEKSKKNKKIINSFMYSLVNASIDCSLHYKKLDNQIKEKIHCKLCAPNNKQLYYPLLNKDMKLPNACEDIKNTKTKVKTIEFDNKKYYYNNENKNIDIFEFNEKFGKYTRMKQTDVLYPVLFDKILNM
jgi:hypothetical protein